MISNKIRGCLLGGAIGDALGYQIEFKQGIRDKQVTRFEHDFGIISDDTQMMLFTANALLWRYTRGVCRGITMPSAESVRHGYLDWLDTQTDQRAHESISWIKEIPELNRRRAPGNTCLSALLSTLHDNQIGTIAKPINNSKGCGTVMRIAPCGVMTEDPHEAGKLAAECAAITHGHPLAIIPSYVCAAMISLLIHHNATIEKAVMTSLNLIRKNRKLFNVKAHVFEKDDIDVFVDLITKAIDLSKQNVTDTDAIKMLGQGWVADEALAIAIYACLKYSDSFEDAVICAVNHDGDSDSTGVIAGNIIGAALGVSKIPPYYADRVELKNVILEISDDIIKAKDESFDIYQDNKWLQKYLYIR